MKSIYTSQFNSLSSIAVEYRMSESLTDSHNLTIKAHDALHADKGGWETNSLMTTAEFTFNMTAEQLKALAKTITEYLATPEPTINDIVKSIQESEVNA